MKSHRLLLVKISMISDETPDDYTDIEPMEEDEKKYKEPVYNQDKATTNPEKGFEAIDEKTKKDLRDRFKELQEKIIQAKSDLLDQLTETGKNKLSTLIENYEKEMQKIANYMNKSITPSGNIRKLNDGILKSRKRIQKAIDKVKSDSKNSYPEFSNHLEKNIFYANSVYYYKNIENIRWKFD